MATIFIRKLVGLDKCPFCSGNTFINVSNSEYPNMYECQNKDCKKRTQIKYDL